MATNDHYTRVGALILCWVASLVTLPGRAADARPLLWHDEFNQPDGAAPDPANWTFDLGSNGWGNGELQVYTDHRTNSRIERGCLVIEARCEPATGTNNLQRTYTSARLKTQDKQSWKFGRVEARIKLPRGQGIWPAFWMLGSDIESARWPACGEIDIMENIGREPGRIHGTIHGPGYFGEKGIGGPYSFPDSVKVADDFHLFAVEWERDRIRWFVDEQPYFSVSPEDLPPESRWVFNHPHFLLLNVAVGGRWPGPPDQTTQFPQFMWVDYVRVYAPTNTLQTDGPVHDP